MVEASITLSIVLGIPSMYGTWRFISRIGTHGNNVRPRLLLVDNLAWSDVIYQRLI